MVRQAYVNRLVLGRSAFDPPQSHDHDRRNSASAMGLLYTQRYNIRGYAENRESRDQARRNRHAQNDILTTIGVCINVDEQGELKPQASTAIPKTSAEQETARQVIEEHWYGSLINNVSEFSSEAGSMWVWFLRARIQTFDFYQGIPLSTIIRSEWNHNSKFSFLAAGILPDTLYHGAKSLVEGILEYGIEPRILDWARRKCAQFGLSPEFWISAGGAIYHLSFFILREATGVMLDIIMYLQELGLISSWPPFPRGTLSILVRLMPPVPTHWDRISALNFFGAVLCSPIALSLVYHTSREFFRELFFKYLRTVLVRPDNPDASSYRLMLEDDQVDLDEAPVLQLPIVQRSPGEQFSRDWNFVRSSVIGVASAVAAKIIDIFGALSLTKLSQTTSSGAHNVSFAFEEDDDAPIDTSGVAMDNTPPHSPGSTSSDILSDIDPSAVQVRTRSGSTSTLHMDLEVQLPISAQQMRERRTSSSAHADGDVIQVVDLPKPPSDHHRVTQLTLHSSWALNVQASAILTSMLLLPLESYYLRVLTRQFLASRGSESAWLARQIYEPSQLGPRGAGWKGFFAYGSQILICYGLETGLRLYFWRICGTISLWWGRQMYHWGRL